MYLYKIVYHVQELLVREHFQNIKTKLISTISKETMETLLLMNILNIERNFEIDKDNLIDTVGKSSWNCCFKFEL